MPGDTTEGLRSTPDVANIQQSNSELPEPSSSTSRELHSNINLPALPLQTSSGLTSIGPSPTLNDPLWSDSTTHPSNLGPPINDPLSTTSTSRLVKSVNHLSPSVDSKQKKRKRSDQATHRRSSRPFKTEIQEPEGGDLTKPDPSTSTTTTTTEATKIELIESASIPAEAVIKKDKKDPVQGEDSPGFSENPKLSTSARASSPGEVEPEPLSDYMCPICFSPPTNATLTPCGHICCGQCLFTAIKSTVRQGAFMMGESNARCPVCRASIPGWDGRGGGVIGLEIRAVLSL